MTKELINALSDEEILNEFVKRFQCDGAILLYFDSNTEVGFSKWTNSNGRKWAKHIFKILKSEKSFAINN